MHLSEDARLHIHPTLDADALRRQALAEGMHPLRAAGVMKVAEGVTTLEEILRTTPAWEGPRAALS
jgi:general secretion pathway protein E